MKANTSHTHVFRPTPARAPLLARSDRVGNGTSWNGSSRRYAALLAALLFLPGAHARSDSGLPFQTLVAVCASCHGQDGRSSVVPRWGRLAGQNRGYLVYALRLYREGGRSGLNAGLMLPYATVLSDQEIERLADHYARLP